MPRWAAKKDTTHKTIVEALEACGWAVLDISRAPLTVDLAIAKKGRGTILVEVKTGKNKLTDGQWKILSYWPAETAVLRCVDDVLALNRSGQDISPPQRGLRRS